MIFQIKKIPSLSWSSLTPLNFRPKRITVFFLCLGLSLFGLGEGLLVVSTVGASPWIVLSEGVASQLGYSVGFTTFLISVVVLLLWFPLKQKPGIGTVMNSLVIALMIDLCNFLIITPSGYESKVILAVLAVLLVGIGSGFYLIANLGAGPRDGLMTGIQKKSGLPIVVVRTTLEISVLTVGWFLGGTVGIGTVLFAFGIGPAVGLGLYLVKRQFNLKS